MMPVCLRVMLLVEGSPYVCPPERGIVYLMWRPSSASLFPACVVCSSGHLQTWSLLFGMRCVCSFVQLQTEVLMAFSTVSMTGLVWTGFWELDLMPHTSRCCPRNFSHCECWPVHLVDLEYSVLAGCNWARFRAISALCFKYEHPLEMAVADSYSLFCFVLLWVTLNCFISDRHCLWSWDVCYYQLHAL